MREKAEGMVLARAACRFNVKDEA